MEDGVEGALKAASEECREGRAGACTVRDSLSAVLPLYRGEAWRADLLGLLGGIWVHPAPSLVAVELTPFFYFTDIAPREEHFRGSGALREVLRGEGFDAKARALAGASLSIIHLAGWRVWEPEELEVIVSALSLVDKASGSPALKALLSLPSVMAWGRGSARTLGLAAMQRVLEELGSPSGGLQGPLKAYWGLLRSRALLAVSWVSYKAGRSSTRYLREAVENYRAYMELREPPCPWCVHPDAAALEYVWAASLYLTATAAERGRLDEEAHRLLKSCEAMLKLVCRKSERLCLAVEGLLYANLARSYVFSGDGGKAREASERSRRLYIHVLESLGCIPSPEKLRETWKWECDALLARYFWTLRLKTVSNIMVGDYKSAFEEAKLKLELGKIHVERKYGKELAFDLTYTVASAALRLKGLSGRSFDPSKLVGMLDSLKSRIEAYVRLVERGVIGRETLFLSAREALTHRLDEDYLAVAKIAAEAGGERCGDCEGVYSVVLLAETFKAAQLLQRIPVTPGGSMIEKSVFDALRRVYSAGEPREAVARMLEGIHRYAENLGFDGALVLLGYYYQPARVLSWIGLESGSGGIVFRQRQALKGSEDPRPLLK
jgi:hypothetical protein